MRALALVVVLVTATPGHLLWGGPIDYHWEEVELQPGGEPPATIDQLRERLRRVMGDRDAVVCDLYDMCQANHTGAAGGSCNPPWIVYARVLNFPVIPMHRSLPSV